MIACYNFDRFYTSVLSFRLYPSFCQILLLCYVHLSFSMSPRNLITYNVYIVILSHCIAILKQFIECVYDTFTVPCEKSKIVSLTSLKMKTVLCSQHVLYLLRSSEIILQFFLVFFEVWIIQEANNCIVISLTIGGFSNVFICFCDITNWLIKKCRPLILTL